jgi:hypothetical protein
MTSTCLTLLGLGDFNSEFTLVHLVGLLLDLLNSGVEGLVYLLKGLIELHQGVQSAYLEPSFVQLCKRLELNSRTWTE